MPTRRLAVPLTPVIAIAVALGLAFGAAAGQTYKWVDKDGKVHYSDKPVAGAEKVELKPLTEIESTPVPPPPAPDDAKPPEPLDSATAYTAMTITSPKAGDTLRGTGAGVTIQVDLQPGLGGDDRIEYTLDGKVVDANVPFIERGTHTVGARVVSADGATKISAPTVTFFVQQAIAKKPAKPTPPKTPPPPTH